MQSEVQEMYVDVALPLALDTPLTYSVPKCLWERALPGMRVLVPMQSRLILGFVVAVTRECSLETVKTVVDFPDTGPVFDKNMLDLCKWVADYYCCSWGEALSAALPAAVKSGVRRRYRLAPAQLSEGRFTELPPPAVAH